MKNFKTNNVTFWVLCFFILVFFELTVFNNGGAFLLVIGAVLLYLSFSKKNRTLKWTGIGFLVLALFTMWSLRLFIFLLFIQVLYNYLKKEHEPKVINDQFFSNIPSSQNELFGTTPSPLEAFKWQDVQIQRLVGDITIDTTQTILPTGTSFISIRQGIGKVQIYIPYEVPFRVQYTTLFGEVKMLHFQPQRLVNEHIQFEDGLAEDAKRKLVIHVASWFGDLEVTRK